MRQLASLLLVVLLVGSASVGVVAQQSSSTPVETPTPTPTKTPTETDTQTSTKTSTSTRTQTQTKTGTETTTPTPTPTKTPTKTQTPTPPPTETPVGVKQSLAEPVQGVHIVDYRFRSGDVVVTWVVTREADLPVKVRYADVGQAVKGKPGVRSPTVKTDVILTVGKSTSKYPATDGPAGQIVQISVGGQPIIIEGRGTGSGELVETIDPTPAVMVGAISGVLVAGLVAYRRRRETLEEPVKARDVWDRD